MSEDRTFDHRRKVDVDGRIAGFASNRSSIGTGGVSGSDVVFKRLRGRFLFVDLKI
jgi:hypothetical protein